MGNPTDEQRVNGFVIEEGVPIPGRRQGKTGIAKVLRELKPGQSVFIANETPETLGSRISYVRMQIKPERLVSRKVEGGVRVWRVS